MLAVLAGSPGSAKALQRFWGARMKLTLDYSPTLVAPGTPVDEVLAAIRDSCPLDSLADDRHLAHLARWPFRSCAAMAANGAARSGELSKGPAANFVGEAD